LEPVLKRAAVGDSIRENARFVAAQRPDEGAQTIAWSAASGEFGLIAFASASPSIGMVMLSPLSMSATRVIVVTVRRPQSISLDRGERACPGR
jgi:hypothetical protein